jgi:restriction system protein
MLRREQGQRDVQYDPDTRELLIKYDLPRQDAVPKIEVFKHLRSKKEVRPVERKAAAMVALYEALVAQTAVRVIAEVLAATPPDRVESVLLNGHVSSIDVGTGHPIQPSILSVLTGRSEFEAMNLDAVDAVACLHRLNAIVSPHPYDLVPVRPVWTFDPSRYKFVQERDVVAGLDHRPDLLQLSPSEFEHLIRRLYEAMGLKAWVTQESKDEGVDAVAINEAPALFGKCVIQAKRYKNPVDAESVYALAGVMEAHKASTGILVTTSYFGSGSKKFAEQHGRMQLHDGRHLKKLLQEFLDLDVLISLEKMPADWRPIDVGKTS